MSNQTKFKKSYEYDEFPLLHLANETKIGVFKEYALGPVTFCERGIVVNKSLYQYGGETRDLGQTGITKILQNCVVTDHGVYTNQNKSLIDDQITFSLPLASSDGMLFVSSMTHFYIITA